MTNCYLGLAYCNCDLHPRARVLPLQPKRPKSAREEYAAGKMLYADVSALADSWPVEAILLDLETLSLDEFKAKYFPEAETTT